MPGRGWAAFDVDNTRALCRELPFCDFGELIDPPSADVTAHVVEMLSILGRNGEPADWSEGSPGCSMPRSPMVRGSAAGGPTTSTARAPSCPPWSPPACPPEHPAIRRAVAWLEAHQNDDGGWGEDLRSYRDPSYRGAVSSNASQTAWALLALLAAGETRSGGGSRAWPFWSRPSGPTGRGTRRGSPAPAFPATSTSTTTSTTSSSPSWRSVATCGGGNVVDLAVLTAERIEAEAIGGGVMLTGVGMEQAFATGTRL